MAENVTAVALVNHQERFFGTTDSRLSAVKICAFIGAVFCACLIAPFFIYGISMAFFGLAHVIFEMRYLQARFQSKVSKTFLIIFGLLLLGIASLRIVLLEGIIQPLTSASIELLLIMLLSVTTMIIIYSALRGSKNSLSFWRAILAGTTALILSIWIGAGIIYAPILTLLIFSITHNFTPLAFIAEACSTKNRWSSLGLAFLVFIGAPILIASGIMENLTALPFFDGNMPGGPIERHLSVYIPKDFLHHEWAIRVFSGFVFAQCMHYGATIYLYPKYYRQRSADNKFWPTRIIFFGVISICLISAMPFFSDFSKARSFYGIFAAIHAWIEIPLLLLLLLGLKGYDEQADAK